MKTPAAVKWLVWAQIVGLALMLWTVAHADEAVDGSVSTNAPVWYTAAPLFMRTGPHSWTVTTVHVPEYPDARPVFCIGTPATQAAECFYRSNDGLEGYEYTVLPKERRS